MGQCRNLAWRLGGCLFFLGLWQVLASINSSFVFPSPVETLNAAIKLLAEPLFWVSGLWPTLWRVLSGFVAGVLVGGTLGLCAGLFPELALFLLPLRWVLSSVPGIVLVILAMLWCGVGSIMVVFIVALTVIPTVYLAMSEGIAALDVNLCEMADLYKLSFPKRLAHIYLPAVSAPLLSACVVGMGGGMRVAILAETFCASQGLGYTLALARSHLDTAQLYAVAFFSMLMVSLIEITLLRFTRNYLQRKEMR